MTRQDTRIRPELTVAIDGEDHPIAWSGPRPADAHPARVVRIRRSVLSDAIRERSRLRADSLDDPADLVVALEVEALIAPEASTARSELLRRGESLAGDTVRYVGTPNGLRTLIEDLYVAEVADAVIVIPIDGLSTAVQVADQVLPRLREASARRAA